MTYVAISIYGQLALQFPQDVKVRFWQPPQALITEYVTVLHAQEVAAAKVGPR